MKEKFQKQLEVLNKANELDISTLADVYGVSKALIKKFKPDYLKEINALNPQPDDINLPGVRHTRNGLKRILKGIITECEIENEQRLKRLKRPFLAVSKSQEEEKFWEQIHPMVCKVSKSLFSGKHYDKAIFAALVELNTCVKTKVGQNSKVPQHLDMSSLMERVFSPADPILFFTDKTHQTAQDLQRGYHRIFSGAMLAIRNPKAHENIELSKEKAIHLIYFCSLLFSKLDEAIIVR